MELERNGLSIKPSKIYPRLYQSSENPSVEAHIINNYYLTVEKVERNSSTINFHDIDEKTCPYYSTETSHLLRLESLSMYKSVSVNSTKGSQIKNPDRISWMLAFIIYLVLKQMVKKCEERKNYPNKYSNIIQESNLMTLSCPL